MTATRIVVLGTGGTIAGLAASPDDHLHYQAAQLGVDRLLESLPAATAIESDIESEQVAQVDSVEMGPALWRALAERCAHHLARPEVAGLVITHGTDTVEETAYLLHELLSPAKPVVLTCAMRPASALGADGPQNLADAVAVARTPGAAGVVLVCHGEIHDAPNVSKAHAYRLAAFHSGDAGPLGYVENGAARLLRPWPAPAQPSWAALPRDADWPWVEILTAYAGADGRAVRALAAAGVRGLVLAATGNGTLPGALEQALLQAQSQGVRVLRSTRCAFGRVLPREDARLPGTPLAPVKARLALQLALALALQTSS